MCKSIIVIHIVFLCFGCSEFNWVRHIEQTENSNWYPNGEMEVSRSISFKQECFQNTTDSISIQVCPGPIRSSLISFGPPFLPIVPFIPFYWFTKEGLLNIELNIKDLRANRNLDLRKIQIVSFGLLSMDSINIFIQSDDKKFLMWKPIDLHSLDSSEYILQLSQNPIRLKLETKICKNNFDTLSINVEGIDQIQIPKLILIRRGKFYYDPLTGGV